MITSTRSRPLPRLVTAIVAGLLAAGILSACGSTNSSSPPASAGSTAETTATTPATTTTEAQTTETQTTPTQPTTQTQTSTQQASIVGKQVFTQNCGSCHTLKAAGTQGQVGPDLDQLKPDAARVERQVKQGGASMPAFQGTLSSAQIKAVAQYVATTAGS